jgi:hypothetical protein
MLRFENGSGIGRDIKITNVETGEDVTKVLGIEFGATIEVGQMITCRANLAMLRLDMAIGKAEFHTKNPVTGRYGPVAAIEFRDGSRVEIAEDGTPTVISK